jgi:hypothetical protein
MHLGRDTGHYEPFTAVGTMQFDGLRSNGLRIPGIADPRDGNGKVAIQAVEQESVGVSFAEAGPQAKNGSYFDGNHDNQVRTLVLMNTPILFHFQVCDTIWYQTA